MKNVEKHAMVGKLLAQHPDHSDRQIAKALAVSPTFVGNVRRYLEEKGQLPRAEKRMGKDGRRRGPRRSREEIERTQREAERNWRRWMIAAINERYRWQLRGQLETIEIEMESYRCNNEPLAQKWLGELEEQRKRILEQIAEFEGEQRSL